MWNAAFHSGLYFYVACYFETTLYHIQPQVERHSGRVLPTGVGTGAVCPGPQGPQTVLKLFKCTSQSKFSKGFISLYCWFQVSLLFCSVLMLLGRKLQCTLYLMWLLCSPLAKAPVCHIFWSETAKQRQKCKHFTDHTCIILTCSSEVLYKPTVGTPLTNYIY